MEIHASLWFCKISLSISNSFLLQKNDIQDSMRKLIHPLVSHALSTISPYNSYCTDNKTNEIFAGFICRQGLEHIINLTKPIKNRHKKGKCLLNIWLQPPYSLLPGLTPSQLSLLFWEGQGLDIPAGTNWADSTDLGTSAPDRKQPPNHPKKK